MQNLKCDSDDIKKAIKNNYEKIAFKDYYLLDFIKTTKTADDVCHVTYKYAKAGVSNPPILTASRHFALVLINGIWTVTVNW